MPRIDGRPRRLTRRRTSGSVQARTIAISCPAIGMNHSRALSLTALLLSASCATTRSTTTTANNANTANTANNAANTANAANNTANNTANTANDSTEVRILGDVPQDATLTGAATARAPNASASAGTAPGAIGVLSIGTTVQGQLEQGDTVLTDESLADRYEITLTAGRPVTIIVRGGPSVTTPGEPLDMYAALLLNNQELVHNDDISPDNRNSRIVYTPTASGPHTVMITTFGSGAKLGPYTIVVMDGARPTAL